MNLNLNTFTLFSMPYKNKDIDNNANELKFN